MRACYLNGAYEEGDGSPLVVENPSDESEVARFAGVSPRQVEKAIAASRASFDDGTWSQHPAHERAAVLRRFVQALSSRSACIADVIVAEAGCPRHTPAMRSQVQLPLRQANHIIDLFLSLPGIEENPLPLDERVNPLGQTIQSLRRHTPVGVVAAIAAYNFPFLTALWKVMPALMAGNSVILRPSPLTPLSAMPFAEAAEEAGLPPGVLNLVLEAGIEGARLLTTDPRVDMVAFTGSTAVGTQVMAQAAATMKRLQLELGGKSAQVFLPDALDRVVAAALQVCTSHAGQGCALGTRIFVPDESKSGVLARIRDAFASIRIGPASDPDTQLGPVISAAQRARCEHFVALGIEHGGTIVTGGKRPAHLDKGYYFEPTVLDLPDNRNPAAQEEVFGPVASVIGYRDLDHAVEMANDSRYGLSGYVHGQDRRKALDVALRLRTGTVNVNGGAMSAYASSGGQRMSGIGRERGIEGLRIYQQVSCLNLGG